MPYCSKPVDTSKLHTSCPVIGMFVDGTLTKSAKQLDENSGGKISKLHKEHVFKGEIGQSFLIYDLAGTRAPYILLMGCGKKGSLTPMQYKKICLQAGKALLAANITDITCFLTEIVVGTHSLPWHIQQIVQVFEESQYCFDLFKTDKKSPYAYQSFTIAIDRKADQKSCDTAIKQALAIAHGVALAKDLANTPSNICTPTFLSDQARAIAEDYATVDVDILGEKKMQSLGMGALLGVSQGSAEEAQLICLKYTGNKKGTAPIAFIGKGVTFDTGGNSIKPADSMVGMKYDMCGGATVLGVIAAAAKMQLPLNLVGIIPAVENMPGGTAYKPEDILTSMSGQTIEVISTDAEGRLALCDALTYCERYNPDTVIDIATLTGAVVIALGSHATAVLSNHDELASDLLQAGEQSTDRAWQLPLWDEYDEQIKSPFADMANVGGRAAGTITAACFLARFTKKFKWAHLDVAGTAAVMSGTSERKATGRPVPMLMQYLINRVK